LAPSGRRTVDHCDQEVVNGSARGAGLDVGRENGFVRVSNGLLDRSEEAVEVQP
jgi:hypothetical protein